MEAKITDFGIFIGRTVFLQRTRDWVQHLVYFAPFVAYVIE